MDQRQYVFQVGEFVVRGAADLHMADSGEWVARRAERTENDREARGATPKEAVLRLVVSEVIQ